MLVSLRTKLLNDAMARLQLSDAHWQRIEHLFAKRSRLRGGRPATDPRKMVNAILWILRTGAPFRDLPEPFGVWQTAWRWFDQWNADGTIDAVLESLQAACMESGALNHELWCVDGTIVRAARCASGGGKKGILTSLPTTHWDGVAADSRRKYTSCATRKGIHSMCI